jgi:hypothetical protein
VTAIRELPPGACGFALENRIFPKRNASLVNFGVRPRSAGPEISRMSRRDSYTVKGKIDFTAESPLRPAAHYGVFLRAGRFALTGVPPD